MIIVLISFSLLFVTISWISEKKGREKDAIKMVQLIKNIVDGKVDLKRIKSILAEYEEKK